MRNNEDFMSFSTRARTLQRLYNFESVKISDQELARYLTFGMPTELVNMVNNFQLMEAKEFKYSEFETRTATFFQSLRPTPQWPASPTQTSNVDYRGDQLWRLKAYLDLVGLCHFCNLHCGSNNGACRGRRNPSRVEIPPSFTPPAKPPNYSPPRAWSSPSNRNTTPQAGRPVSRPAGVASAEEDNQFPDLQASSIEMYRDIDEHVAALGYTNSNSVAAGAAALAISNEAVGEDEYDFLAAVTNPLNKATVATVATAEPAFNPSTVLTPGLLGDIEDTKGYVAYAPPPNRKLHEFHRGRHLRGGLPIVFKSNRSPGRHISQSIQPPSPLPPSLPPRLITIPVHSSVPTVLQCLIPNLPPLSPPVQCPTTSSLKYIIPAKRKQHRAPIQTNCYPQ
ncbi:hypothetical protein PTTG_10078, partial [Puccinia triticina 1-1 BBBD Race 1]|uniref:Uncharacterized protein n=1 Tax=Puccinia triticina (isolate 1-1 / race 1 (BBBD)) TaxID=630390 RepID=A0A0C4FA37_PUCT1